MDFIAGMLVQNIQVETDIGTEQNVRVSVIMRNFNG